jgi:sRNA-binding carbon storage regulator CsrA
MLLLMRREGEAVRINENITLEVKQINEEEVVFHIEGISESAINVIVDKDKTIS